MRYTTRNMTKIKLLLLILLTMLTVSSNAEGIDNIVFPYENWRPDLLKIIEDGPALLDRELEIQISEPPKNSSYMTKAELDRLEYSDKKLRSKEQLELIYIEDSNISADLYLERSGILPTRENAPVLRQVVDMLLHEVNFFTMREKKKHNRARPTQLRSGIQAVIPIPGHPSYPSGHAAQMHAISYLIHEVKPDCHHTVAPFLSSVAIRREIAGVHYLTDTIAGQQLAQTVLDELKKIELISNLIDIAKTEMNGDLCNAH